MVQCSTVIARQHAWYCTARYCNSTVCPMPVLCLNICIYRQTLPTFLYGYHSSFAYTTLLLRNSNGKASVTPVDFGKFHNLWPEYA